VHSSNLRYVENSVTSYVGYPDLQASDDPSLVAREFDAIVKEMVSMGQMKLDCLNRMLST